MIDVIRYYEMKFSGEVYDIKSYDFYKSIPILNKSNDIMMPHNYITPDKIKDCVNFFF